MSHRTNARPSAARHSDYHMTATANRTILIELESAGSTASVSAEHPTRAASRETTRPTPHQAGLVPPRSRIGDRSPGRSARSAPSRAIAASIASCESEAGSRHRSWRQSTRDDGGRTGLGRSVASPLGISLAAPGPTACPDPPSRAGSTGASASDPADPRGSGRTHGPARDPRRSELLQRLVQAQHEPLPRCQHRRTARAIRAGSSDPSIGPRSDPPPRVAESGPWPAEIPGPASDATDPGLPSRPAPGHVPRPRPRASASTPSPPAAATTRATPPVAPSRRERRRERPRQRR